MTEEEKAKAEEKEAEEQAKKMDQLIAKTWVDEAFKQRLMSDPLTVLKEEGIEIAEGIQVRVVEDTDTVMHLVLPPKPSEDELSDEELSDAAGGQCRCGPPRCGPEPRWCGPPRCRCGCGCGCGCSFRPGCRRCRC